MRLISQAISAAKNSLDLAQQLLGEIQGNPQTIAQKPVGVEAPPRPQVLPTPLTSNTAREQPGMVGSFDGENLETPSGEKYKVPENYASKTGLVFGDKLKIIDLPGSGKSEKIFKQIERVKRLRVEGVLSKSEKGWKLATADGSHTVLEAAVKHFGGQVGTEMFGLLPKDNPHVSFAALEGLVNPPVVPEPRVGEKKEAGEKATTAIPEDKKDSADKEKKPKSKK